MVTYRRVVDYLAAISIIIAFGALFLGRLMTYSLATATGTFLERVAAQSRAWDFAHRVMLVGIIGLIPAAIALRRAARGRSTWLADIAAGLIILGAALGVGQYALDFAMLAAARIEPSEAGESFISLLRGESFVDWAFYKLPGIAQLGLVLFTVVMWLQGTGWRLQAVSLTVAAVAALVAPLLIGPVGIRLALGLAFLGFATVAWKIAFHPLAAERLPS